MIRHVVLFSTVLATSAAWAHHSFTMFDDESEITIEGTVTSYAWSNPHIWIDVSVEDENGQLVNWGLESRSVGILSRLGWGHESIKAGDRVTALINPMQDGTPGGSVITITFEDGRVLSASPRTSASEGPQSSSY